MKTKISRRVSEKKKLQAQKKSKPKSYPEHEKMRKVRGESQAQGEFLEWLGTQEIHLCRYVEGRLDYYEPVTNRIETLLAQYHGIDLKKIEAEKQQMLDELRKGMK